MTHAAYAKELQFLQLKRDMVALESMNSVTEGMKSLAERFFPPIIDSYHKFVKTLAMPKDLLKPNDFFNTKEKFNKTLAGVSYMDINQVTVFVPEGLTTDFLSYSTIMSAAAQRAADVENELVKFSKYLAVLLSDKDAKLESLFNPAEFKAMEASRKAMIEAMAEHFAKDSSRTVVAYGNAIKRNSDWHEIFKAMEHQEKLINPAKLTSIKKLMDETADLLTRILKAAERKEFANASPDAIRKMASYVYEMASEVEFYSVVFYRCMALQESVKQTMEKVQVVVKR